MRKNLFDIMEYKEFLMQLQKRVGKDKKTTERLSSMLVKTLREECSDMNMVMIKGFGNFEPKKKLEREIYNPSTGSKMLVPPKIVLTFKPSTSIKNQLKEIKDNE